MNDSVALNPEKIKFKPRIRDVMSANLLFIKFQKPQQKEKKYIKRERNKDTSLFTKPVTLLDFLGYHSIWSGEWQTVQTNAEMQVFSSLHFISIFPGRLNHRIESPLAPYIERIYVTSTSLSLRLCTHISNQILVQIF